MMGWYQASPPSVFMHREPPLGGAPNLTFSDFCDFRSFGIAWVVLGRLLGSHWEALGSLWHLLGSPWEVLGDLL